jgi:hypothetical protein
MAHCFRFRNTNRAAKWFSVPNETPNVGTNMVLAPTSLCLDFEPGRFNKIVHVALENLPFVIVCLSIFGKCCGIPFGAKQNVVVWSAENSCHILRPTKTISVFVFNGTN